MVLTICSVANISVQKPDKSGLIWFLLIISITRQVHLHNNNVNNHWTCLVVAHNCKEKQFVYDNIKK